MQIFDHLHEYRPFALQALCAGAYTTHCGIIFLQIILTRRVCAWRSAGRVRAIQEIAKLEADGTD
jgi:hypothetical protein